ncbi:tRNA (adenosine(37)-N6)-dimethylallyltransferase MiaA [Rathayibacter soli]|uniref:tRNA (adenosine(37)-N6)-dimethylallyltransferase MiaA n=1 Tax=Rathayibacter soli TaxID=3144168 RepID=UPI0027E5087D|nr:tRNA (adenosine(37)-N6)-dimethylallyltransferase MiaA [Glaciibacter superstes]
MSAAPGEWSRSSAVRELIVIVGATGTGKSECALSVAERIEQIGGRAEIINADAMQLYRGMNIGTAKLSPAERRGITHHLLDVLDVTEDASVAWYQPRARALVEEITARGAVPILVGGSGLYVSSVIYDFAFPPRDPTVRARLENELNERGPGWLHARLRTVQPHTADRIDPANGRRIVRALEVFELSGQGHGGALPVRPTAWREARLIGLHTPRGELTARLDARVERMWARGMLEEVASLIPAGLESGGTASRAIGYAQALLQLHGELSQADAISQTQQLTRRYARRQVSWFKRYADLVWFDSADPGLVDGVITALTIRP